MELLNPRAKLGCNNESISNPKLCDSPGRSKYVLVMSSFRTGNLKSTFRTGDPCFWISHYDYLTIEWLMTIFHYKILKLSDNLRKQTSCLFRYTFIRSILKNGRLENNLDLMNQYYGKFGNTIMNVIAGVWSNPTNFCIPSFCTEVQKNSLVNLTEISFADSFSFGIRY